MKKLIYILIFLLCFAVQSQSTMLFDEDFEGIALGTSFDRYPDPGDSWKSNDPGEYRDNEVVNTIVNSGSQAHEIWSDCDGTTDARRSELIWQDQSSSGGFNIANQTEYWVKWYRYLGSDYPDRNDADNFINLFFQIKLLNTTEWTKPAMSIQTSSPGYRLVIRSDADTTYTAYDRNDWYNIGDYTDDKETWVEWIVHFKLDYDGGNNFLEIYKDGVLFWKDPKAGGEGSENGMGYNDTTEDWYFIAEGQYLIGCDSGYTGRYTSYTDDSKIGDSNETLATMSDTSGISITGPSSSQGCTDTSDPYDATQEVTMTIVSSENATCKYDTSTGSDICGTATYAGLANTFTDTTDQTTHTTAITSSCDTSVDYSVICIDNAEEDESNCVTVTVTVEAGGDIAGLRIDTGGTVSITTGGTVSID